MNGITTPITPWEATRTGSWYHREAHQSEISRLLLLKLLDQEHGMTYDEVRERFLQLLDVVEYLRRDEEAAGAAFALVFEHPTLPGILDELVGTFFLEKEEGKEPRYALLDGTRAQLMQRFPRLREELPRPVLDVVS